MHQKLGKPIPEIKIPEPEKKKEETETGKNVVKTTAPKINFVGGSKLASTGSDEKGEGKNGEAESQSNHEIPVENDPIGKCMYCKPITSLSSNVCWISLSTSWFYQPKVPASYLI